jgi:hypothetical protein
MHHHRALWLQRLFLRWALRIAVGSYRHYGLPEPDHKLFEHHPTISSELFQYLKHGQIVVHPDIRAFDGNVVEFADGTSEAFDIVVAATGFHLSFPFLAPELVAVNDPLVEVYGAMMTTLHRHLYIVGWMQARYGFGPLFGPKADLLAQIIKTQDRMRNSFGSVMKQLGQKPPRTNLFDPHRIKRQVNLMRHVLPFVRLIDGWIKPSVQ